MALPEDDTQLVHAYLDGELDVAAALAVERKIAADPALRELATDIAALKEVLAENFPREPVPAELQKRIDAAVRPHRAGRIPRWLLMAASVLMTAALSSTFTAMWLQGPVPGRVGAELIDGHLRSLMAAQPTDIGSSEQHTVKPWFNGRITQSPRVVDLHSQGFELAGGRIDVVGKTPLPTLVYRRRQHVISLTEFVGEGRSATSFERRKDNGFNIIRWNDNDRSYIAISDLNAAELETFARSFRDAAG